MTSRGSVLAVAAAAVFAIKPLYKKVVGNSRCTPSNTAVVEAEQKAKELKHKLEEQGVASLQLNLSKYSDQQYNIKSLTFHYSYSTLVRMPSNLQ